MNNVDQRIVEMRFNNKQFEAGIQQSNKSLKELDKALKLDVAAKSLSNLEAAGNKFSLAGMSEGVSTLTSRFSTMGIVGMTAIQQITMAAIDAGVKIVKALTINPIKEGFDEYEMSIKAAKVMMSGTGEAIDTVNKALDRLNKYSDDTIYSFKDMTANISKFTNAGLSSADAATAIIGISNAAALAGASAEDAGRAMYQLGQALGGNITAEDWNSVENANMATVGFKNSLLEAAAAAGMLKKNSNGMYVTPKGTAISATKDFRKSLEQLWLTGDVLTKVLRDYGDETTEIGKKAFAAAKDITSGTQLLSIIRESIVGSWTNTWKILIGDAEQAKAFWTAVGEPILDFISAIGEARNKVLEFWSANKGRENLLIGVANILITIGKVLAPLEATFGKVFSFDLGGILVYWTQVFRDFTEVLVGGDKASSLVVGTLKIMFSVFGIAITAIKTGINVLLNFFKVLLPLGSGFGVVANKIGDFLVKVQEVVNIFATALNSKISSFATILRNSFVNLQFPSIDKLKTKIQELLKALNVGDKTTQAFQNAFAGFIAVLDRVSQKIDAVKVKMRDFLASVSFGKNNFQQTNTAAKQYTKASGEMVQTNQDVAESFSTFDLMIQALKAGLKELASYLTPLKNSIMKVFGTLKNQIQKNLGDITFDQVISAINTFIGGSLMLSIRRMVKIINKSLPDLLESTKNVLDTVRTSLEAWQNNLKSKMILNIAIALGVLTVAIIALSRVDPGKLAKSLGALTVMFGQALGGLAIFTKIVSGKTFAGLFSLSFALTGLSIAVTILSSAMLKLQKLDWNGITKGLVTITVLLAELSIVSRVMAAQTGSVFISSLSLLALSISINNLSSALEKLGKIPWRDIMQGLAAISVALAAIVILGKVSETAKLASAAVGIFIVGAALHLLASAVAIFGNMNMETLSTGLKSVAIALTLLTASMMLIPVGLLGSSVGMVAIAGALLLLTSAVGIFGNMKVETIKQGLITIALSLTILVIALNALTATVPSAIALFIVAGALTALTIPIAIFGNMNWKVIAGGLLSIAISLGVLAGLSYLLAPLAPVMLAVSGSILMFGLGLAGVSVAMVLFAAALVALIPALGAIILAIPQLGKIIQSLLTEINKIIPMLEDSLKLLLQLFINILPDLDKALRGLLDVVIKLIADYTPKIVQLILDMVFAIIDALNANLDVLAEKITEFIIALLNAVAKSIEKNGPKILDAVGRLASSILDTFVEALLPESFGKAGADAIVGFVTGVVNAKDKVVKVAKDFGGWFLEAFKKAVDSNSPWETTKQEGKNAVDGLAIGFKEQSKKVTTNLSGTFMQMGDNIKNMLGKQTEKEGTKAIEKTTASMTKAAAKGGKSAAEKASEAAKKAFQASLDWIEERKYYNELSLEQELAAWQRVQARYLAGTEERKKADREVYRVKQELIKKELDDANKARQDRFTNSKNWIDQEVFYDRYKLTEQLAAWRKVQDYSEVGSDDYKEASRNIYSIQKEIDATNKDFTQKALDVQTNANEERIRLEDEYYAKTEEINKKLKADIDQVTKEYQDAVKQRSQSLYNAFGLFDRVPENKKITGFELLKNLQQQVKMFEFWRKNIGVLANRGLDPELIKELQAMGPQALAEIQGLTQLSDKELRSYVTLWKQKHSQAKSEATTELEGLRTESIAKIEQLGKDAEVELTNFVTSWGGKFLTFKKETLTTLDTLRQDWLDKMGDMRKKTDGVVLALIGDVKKTIETADWSTLADGVIGGLVVSIEDQSVKAAEAMTKLGTKMLETLKDTFDQNSPSKEFAKIGTFAILGLIEGIKATANSALSATGSFGNQMISTLQGSLSSTLSLLDGPMNLQPTIRPVIDMSNVEAGMASTFGQNRTLKVSGVVDRAAIVAANAGISREASAISNQTDNSRSSEIKITNNYTVRSNEDIRKISTDLKNTLDRYSYAKGVLVT